jgi:hypothetical protein
MKIGVVAICTLPLVAALQKKHMFCPFWAIKNGKSAFYVSSKKFLVTKVIGLGNMHISAKTGASIQNFAMKLAKPRSLG